jgi:hypothetical protein
MARRTAGAVLCLLALAATACTGSDDPKTPAATVDKPSTTEPSTTTTSEPQTPEQEVEAAYLMSWDIYSEAVRTFDITALSQSYGGEALTVVSDEVRRLQAAETPLVVQVEHDLHVQIVSASRALVRDKYVNRNYRTDAAGKPIDPTDDPGTYLETYQMERSGNSWLVMRIVRESHQQ